MTLAVAIAGASGRLGSLALRACSQAQDLDCCAALVSAKSEALGQDAGDLIGGAPLGLLLSERPTRPFDVLLDFSLAPALERWIEVCEQAAKPLVVAATGHSEAQLGALGQLAQRVPVLLAPNLALGPNLLLRMVREAAELLGPEFDAGIQEVHHQHKRDAPSGTARALAEALEAGCGRRPSVTSQRLGEVAGEHSVRFTRGAESLTLTHQAQSPAIFVQGALRALRWIVQEPPGLYSMQDLLASSGSVQGPGRTL